ncbi:DUF5133 domain-containing protein [Streptomyces sp. NRRL F-4428]|uniref:DUF5133 domain-containing protein n=1 Tax=Streptomyces sp. NRRL F-4428 TaxID=1609137 RepID=UPI000AE1E495|nr:DUF5133 domain-containing protein [Streptomyces sp. NRRL F-4428]
MTSQSIHQSSVGHVPVLRAEQAVEWATGMVMALAPCGTREARLVLAAAAERVLVPPAEFAAAMVSGAYGVPVPALWERALRRAVEALLRPPPGAEAGRGVRGVGLLPSRARTREALARFRVARERLAAAPGDRAARSAMDDAAYTLCVLMGRSAVHEAVLAAELHLAGPD